MANQQLPPEVLAAYGSTNLTPEQWAVLHSYFGVQPEQFNPTPAVAPDAFGEQPIDPYAKTTARGANDLRTGYDLAAYLSERNGEDSRSRLNNIYQHYGDTLKGQQVQTRKAYPHAQGPLSQQIEVLNPITQQWELAPAQSYSYEGGEGFGVSTPDNYRVQGQPGYLPQSDNGERVSTTFNFQPGQDGSVQFGGLDRVYEQDATLWDSLAPVLMLAAPFAAAINTSLAAGAAGGAGGGGAAGGGGLAGGSGAFVGEAPWAATGGGPLQFGSSGSGGGLLDSIGNGIRSVGNSISDGVSSIFPSGSGSVANPGGSEYFLGEGMASGVPGWDAAAVKAGLSLAAPAAAGAAKWLGPASTLLGGLAGAQGQKTEETSQRRTDPRVDPYLFGANGQPGLLQMSYDKLVGQMAPGGLQGYDDMQRVGMGLLNAPVAGNGFGLFGRYR